MVVVKLGGSLITEKSSYCEICTDAVRRFGLELRAAIETTGELPIIVLGGGSFGSGIPPKFSLMNAAARLPEDLSRMTIGMFELMSKVIAIWRSQGLACMPIQASAVVQQDDAGCTIHIRPFQSALKQGLVPVTTGDLLLDSQFVIYSSDFIPGLIAQAMDVDTVVMLTDVTGVLDTRCAEKRLLARIVAGDRSVVLPLAGSSSQADITGGMRTKVAALFDLLDHGVESIVADGREPGMLSRILEGHVVTGSYFVENASPSEPRPT